MGDGDGDCDGGGMGMETMKVGERGMEMVHLEGRLMRFMKVVGIELVKVEILNVELHLGVKVYCKRGLD